MESENINEASGKKVEVSILHIVNVDLRHIGEYKCHAGNNIELDFHKIILNVTLPSKVIEISKPIRTKLHGNVTLHCLVEGYPIDGTSWLKDNKNATTFTPHVRIINETLENTSIEIRNISNKDNGTYTCITKTGNLYSNSSTAILVLDKPQISIDFIKAIGVSKIFLNWTVKDGNEPESLHYQLQYKVLNDTNWYYYLKEIGSKNRSHVLQDQFQSNTEYVIRMRANNSEGESQYSTTAKIRTLSEDPIFIPEVQVNGVTVNSITVRWTNTSEKLKDFVHYYQLLSHANNESDPMEAVHLASKENLYMFSDLSAATTYNFQVAACNEYSHQCGPWSEKVNGTTLDGISGPPENVTIECKFDNISHASFVFVTWKPPLQPHGTVVSYNVSTVELL